MLWDVSVNNFDAFKAEYFTLYVALLWTINDFVANGNLFGWSVKENVACPICNKDTWSRYLPHWSKHCYIVIVGFWSLIIGGVMTRNLLVTHQKWILLASIYLESMLLIKLATSKISSFRRLMASGSAQNQIWFIIRKRNISSWDCHIEEEIWCAII